MGDVTRGTRRAANPAMSFTAEDARKGSERAGSGKARVAEKMAEAYCRRVVIPFIREAARAGRERPVTLEATLGEFMNRVWGREPTDMEWEGFRQDKAEWGTKVPGELGCSDRQPWNRDGNPYDAAMPELGRMLKEAGYEAFARMDTKGEPVYAGGSGMYAVVLVTVGW